MSGENKEKKEEEKKPVQSQPPQPSTKLAPPAQPQVAGPAIETPSPTPAAQPIQAPSAVVPPRPTVATTTTPTPARSAPAPSVPARPVPPSAVPPSGQKSGRRGFIKIIAVVGGLLALAPWVPFGQYLSASVRGSSKAVTQRVFIDNSPQYQAAAGKPVKVDDLTTFPPDSHWVITYPSSGDPTADAQNTDSFYKFELIRLPAGELGGDKADASAFAAFSKVCVHLWCSPNYNPSQGHEKYECPCHGSTYRVPDGLAVAGPASIQPPPTNAIPLLTLSVDSDGFLLAGLYNSTDKEPGTWDVTHNGVLGYGRYVPGVTE